MNNSPFIESGPMRFLNVPHAREVIEEVVTHDCYRLRGLNKDYTFLDLGGFYGEASVFANYLGMPVVMFEPSKASFQIARINFRLNDIDPEYSIHRRAISDSNIDAAHYYRTDHPAGSGLDAKGEPEIVAGITIDAAVSIAKAKPRSKLAVKMDIEGAEQIAFRTAKDWLQWVDFIAIEAHDHDCDYYQQILELNGFKSESTGTGVPPRLPWDKTMAGGLVYGHRRTKE